MGPSHCTVAHAAGVREHADLVVRALLRGLGGGLRGRRIAVWGLDTRVGSAGPRADGARLVEALLDAGAAVSAHDDPPALEAARGRLGHRALLLDDGYLAALDAEALVLTSAWPRERRLDLERLRECMAWPLLVDARGSLTGSAIVGFGLGLGLGQPFGSTT